MKEMTAVGLEREEEMKAGRKENQHTRDGRMKSRTAISSPPPPPLPKQPSKPSGAV